MSGRSRGQNVDRVITSVLSRVSIFAVRTVIQTLLPIAIQMCSLYQIIIDENATYQSLIPVSQY